MSIQILSDLHLEHVNMYHTFEIAPKAPYLALLGDIGTVVPDRDALCDFLVRQLRQFRVVFFVSGNHEPYYSTWSQALDILGQFEQRVRQDASLGEFVLLDRRAYQLPGTKVFILGCSFFSRIPPESQHDIGVSLKDFGKIKNWDTNAHIKAHQRDLAWLNTQVTELERSDAEIVIFSHWSPSTDSRAIDPRHWGSSITCAFSSDMSTEPCFKSAKVKLWAFGHTHFNCDFMIQRDNDAGPLRILANQRGFFQAKGYNPEMTVDLTATNS